jgi:elongator complex protein 3
MLYIDINDNINFMVENIEIRKEAAIKSLLRLDIKTVKNLAEQKRKISKRFNIRLLKNSDILAVYKKSLEEKIFLPRPLLEGALRKRAIRTQSGIAPIAVLTMPYPCPGKCVYCPTEKDVPQSYLSNEPAVMRAIRCDYKPYEQVASRLTALENNGHNPSKIELIVIGGTWSVLPEKYKYWFILECFRAANDHTANIRKSLASHNSRGKKKAEHWKLGPKLKLENLRRELGSEQRKNESSKYKIIGITLETRPDRISAKELREMRELGCTRVELGVQAIDDKILKLNKRGHGVREISAATELLKNYGFKVTYHLMPGLPGSTPEKDLSMFKELFLDERFQPDQIKFYPTVVTKGSLLYRWWRDKKFLPYPDNRLQRLIIQCKKNVPLYVRIIRLVRDIPGESIVAGNQITNLRQVMKDRNVPCRCIRCREAKEKKYIPGGSRPSIISYSASGGEEYFLSFESDDQKILYGFCRLRIPGKMPEHDLPQALSGAAIIRELHVYGELTPIGAKGNVQHMGLGKRLMLEAENIARTKGFKKVCIISGIGARKYYRKLGYRLNQTYMQKTL